MPRRATRSRWRNATILSTAVVAALATSLTGPNAPSTAQPVPASPNVVLIVVDDMRWDEMTVPTALGETLPASYLPTIRRELIAKGFAATNAFVPNSLCCPSRASILTGNYSHTTGVWNNQNVLGRGGFASFRPLEGSTLATWFHAAGYRTGLVGKYLNGYTELTHVPQGWDRWVAFRAGTIGYYAYRLSIDGVPRIVRLGARGLLDGRARQPGHLVHRLDARRHAAVPDVHARMPRTIHSRRRPVMPRLSHPSSRSAPPNLNEADVSDKPAWVRGLPPTVGVLRGIEAEPDANA